MAQWLLEFIIGRKGLDYNGKRSRTRKTGKKKLKEKKELNKGKKKINIRIKKHKNI